jgi:hypothetical protein
LKKIKKRVLLLLLVWVMTTLLVAIPAAAEETDAVDQLAAAMYEFQEKISVSGRDADGLLSSVFERYPILAYYYSGCSYLSTQEGLEYTMYYQNTDKEMSDVWVVDSYQKLMAAIGLSMCDGEETVNLVLTPAYVDDGSFNLPDEIQLAISQLEQDYYMIFMGYENAYTSTSYSLTNNTTIMIVTLDLSIWSDLDKDTMFLWRDEVERNVAELCTTTIAQDMPEGVKELLIHDWLVNNNYYDQVELDDDAVPIASNHTAYGAFTGKCVCEGYAQATHLLLKAVGMTDYTIVGTANGGGHAWNVVQVDGEWYCLDTTWDDPTTSDGTQVLSHDYFNVTDSQLAENHTADEPIYPTSYPSCTSTAMDYSACQALLDQGTSGYSDYSTDYVETQEQDRQILLGLFGDTTVDTPADTQTATTDTQTTETDPATESQPAEEDATDTTAEVSTATNSADDDDDDDSTSVLDELLGITGKTTSHDSEPMDASNVILVLVLALVVIVVVVLVVEMKIRSRLAEKRKEREEYRREKLASGTPLNRKGRW